jgi:hypothetical protein
MPSALLSALTSDSFVAVIVNAIPLVHVLFGRRRRRRPLRKSDKRFSQRRGGGSWTVGVGSGSGVGLGICMYAEYAWYPIYE